ncbi:MAG: hypothetical protein VX871_11765, partial [Pseudomonadota bacterium]|nr:hypothetical protein [Pseudomonadota bacterium]
MSFLASADMLRDNLPLLFALCLFGVVAIVTFRIALVVQGREEIRRRALALDGSGRDPMKDRRSLSHQRLARTSRLLESVGANFAPSDKQSLSIIRGRLTQAGYFHPSAMLIYFASRIVLALLLPFGLFVASSVFGLRLDGSKLMMYMVLAGGA